METIIPIITLLLGAIISFVALSFSFKKRSSELKEQHLQELESKTAVLQERLDNKENHLLNLQKESDQHRQNQEKLQEENTFLKTQNAELKTKLEDEIKQTKEKLSVLEQAEKKFSDVFKSLSSEVLQNNNKTFLDLAKENLEKYQESAKDDLSKRHQSIQELVNPLKESLTKVDGKIHELEKERGKAYATLYEQVKFLSESQQKLQLETGNLVKALRAPQVRGRWGEISLKRVAEMSGMIEHCDFVEQESKNTDSGRLRPDMIVKLPNEKLIVVDSKTPLEAYLRSLEAQTEKEQKQALLDHARQVQTHLKQLGQKSYWDQFKPSPEFVVMFVPGENFFSAALSQNPNLIEEGVQQGVILATPTTLISLLKSVGYGWKQEQLAQNAKEISELGKELHDRISTLASHFEGLGNNLKRSVDSYNKAVGTLETRILPQARRFQELGISSKSSIKRVESVEKVPRDLQVLGIESAETEKKTLP